MSKKRIQELQNITARLGQLDVSKLSESQLAERNTLIKNIKEELTNIKYNPIREGKVPGVDARGRTQEQWLALVKAKFPDGGSVTVTKLIQAKMIDGPIIAYLSNGKQIGWKKVEQPGTNPTQQSNQQGVLEADKLPRPNSRPQMITTPGTRPAPQKQTAVGDIVGFTPQTHDYKSSGKVFKAEVLEIGGRLGRSGILLKLLNPEDIAANGGKSTMQVSSMVSKIQNPYVESAQQGMTEDSPLDRARQRVHSQGFSDSPEERNADRLERKRRHNANLDRISRISGLGGEEEAKHKAQQRMARDEYELQRRKDDDEDTRKTFDLFRDRLNRMQYKNQRDVDPEQLKKITDIKYTPIREDAGVMTPNWAKYVLDQIYNSNGDVTLTDLFDEGIPGLHDMFIATAQKHGFDPEEDFEDVQHELTVELEDIIKGGHGLDEAKGLHKRVKIVKGPDAGKYGWIRQVKHGLYKGAPKKFDVDIEGGGQANQLPASALRLAKEQQIPEASDPQLDHYHELIAQGMDPDQAEEEAYMNPPEVDEGYTVTRGIDKERYQERSGLEGPFHTKSGKVVYYDKQEGKYYDPDTDMFIEYDDWQAMNEQGAAEGMDDSPVASAITRRIMSQRVDLLSKYGPEKVLSAIEDVADFVGDVEEIGSSDVSGWVKQVERTLGDTTGITTEAYDRLKKVFDFSDFKG